MKKTSMVINRMGDVAFRNLLLAKYTNKRKLTNVQLDKVRQYLNIIHCNKYTDVQLAIEYHFTRLDKELATLYVTNTDTGVADANIYATNIHEYQNAKILEKDELNTLIKKYKNMQLPLPTTAIELETIFNIEAMSNINLVKEIVPYNNLKYNYLLLDTNNIYEVNDSRTTFKWLINDGPAQRRTGYINLHSKMANIKMARLSQCVFSHMNDNEIDIFRSQRRISFSFAELSAQSLIAPNGSKFQFMANRVRNNFLTGPSFILSTFEQNHGWFRFRSTISTLDYLTLTIWDYFNSVPQEIALPDVYLSFPAELVLNESIDDGAYFTFTAYNYISVPDFKKYMFLPKEQKTPPLDGLGRPIYMTLDSYLISGFTSNDPVGDAAVISQYNSVHYLRYNGERGIYYQFDYNPANPYGNDGIFVSPIDLDTVVVDLAGIDSMQLTLTLIYKPRFTAVLELLSD